MARPTANQRLFVACYPPADFGRRAIQSLASLDLSPRRLTPPEQVHLTLQFIGDTPAKELARVSESVARAAAGLEPFVLRARGHVTLPERGAVRLVAMETDAPPPLLELKRRLVTRLASRPRRRGDDRFRPHLTLARFPGRGVRRADLPEAWPPPDPAPFTVREIALVRSRLAPEGARHEVIRALALA